MNRPAKPGLGKRYAVLGVFAMLVWQAAWQGWLAPPDTVPIAVAVFLATAPMLPAALLAVVRHPSAVFWAGVASLLYFSHAIAELRAVPDLWPLALVELGLSLWIIFTGNWDALQAKLFKRSRPDKA